MFSFFKKKKPVIVKNEKTGPKIEDIYPEILRNGSLSEVTTGETDGHFFNFFADVVKIVKPKNILEIGMNRGHGSLVLLLTSDANLTSIDLNYPEKSVNTLKMLFNERFTFIQMNSQELPQKKEWVDFFDLIFIDGDHTEAGISTDTISCFYLNSRWILYDDWDHKAHRDDLERITKSHERLVKIREYKDQYTVGKALFLVLPE